MEFAVVSCGAICSRCKGQKGGQQSTQGELPSSWCLMEVQRSAFSLPFTPCTTFCAEQKVPTTSLFLQRHPERSNIVIMRRRAPPPRAQQLGVLGKGAVLRQTQDCDSEQLVSVSSKTAEHMLLENCWKQDLLCGKLACTASSSL